MKKNILFALTCFFCTLAIADDNTIYSVNTNGTALYFLINEDEESVTITYSDSFSFTSSGGDGFYYTGENLYSGDIIIPEQITYNGVPYTVTQIGEGAFCVCEELGSVQIPNTVTEIGLAAFYRSGLTSINIPASVRTIEKTAFSSCSALASVDISKGVTSIGNHAFFSCSSLTSITLPEGVVAIEDMTFTYCYLLNTIVIPESVTYIGLSAFDDDESLTSIYIKGTNIPDIAVVAFYNINPDCYLYVSKGMKDAYFDCFSSLYSSNHHFDYDHIIEYYDLPEAIPTVTTTTKSVVGYYDISGRKLTAPTGVTIIRYSDGTAEKILAK